jgi:hypothetical protein
MKTRLLVVALTFVGLAFGADIAFKFTGADEMKLSMSFAGGDQGGGMGAMEVVVKRVK